MKKMLLLATLASLVGNCYGFGSEAEQKAGMAKKNCINGNLLINVIDESRKINNVYGYVDINGVDADGKTVLMFAASNNKNPNNVINLLSDNFYQGIPARDYIKNGKINSNVTDNSGSNALTFALNNRHFIANQLDSAAIKNVIEMIKALLKAGANANNKPNFWQSPLDLIKGFAENSPEFADLLQWMIQNKYAPREQAPGGPKIAE